MSARFFRYDAAELRAVGTSFVDAVRAIARHPALAGDPDVWSEVALDYFAAARSERARVDAEAARPHLTAELYRETEWAPCRSVVRRGPLAMSHLSHPSFEDGGPHGYAHWQRAFETERLETLLALACEWGGGGRPAARYGRVMLACADLATVEARAKVVLFASDDEPEHRRIVEGLTKLRLASWDARPWLYVDIPWRSDFEAHPPRAALLEG
jgi:hypothetical protein